MLPATSSSVMVRVAVVWAPRTAPLPTGFRIWRLIVSASSSRVSLVMGTVKVALVAAPTKVTLPLAAV